MKKLLIILSLFSFLALHCGCTQHSAQQPGNEKDTINMTSIASINTTTTTSNQNSTNIFIIVLSIVSIIQLFLICLFYNSLKTSLNSISKSIQKQNEQRNNSINSNFESGEIFKLKKRVEELELCRTKYLKLLESNNKVNDSQRKSIKEQTPFSQEFYPPQYNRGNMLYFSMDNLLSSSNAFDCSTNNKENNSHFELIKEGNECGKFHYIGSIGYASDNIDILKTKVWEIDKQISPSSTKVETKEDGLLRYQEDRWIIEKKERVSFN
jgi:hypothetical protein